jgi:D-amino peptidase
VNVYLSIDIEGISGLVAWSQCGRPNSEHFDYRWARERMTADVNAAIRGARAAGATRILIKDSHGNSKNLLIDMLEPGVELVSGHGSRFDGMMNGIDDTFEAAALIGYHAMAGTQGGVMEHTISGRVHRMWLNDRPCGEIGLSTAVAGKYGVPLVAISSDQAGCDETAALIPGVRTAVVKQGYGRYMAEMLHPDQTAALIERAVREGIESRSEIQPWKPTAPVHCRIEFNRTEEADMAARCPLVERLDGYTLEVRHEDFDVVHRAIWTMISLAQAGFEANN